MLAPHSADSASALVCALRHQDRRRIGRWDEIVPEIVANGLERTSFPAGVEDVAGRRDPGAAVRYPRIFRNNGASFLWAP
jgi:hypothetical protein